jgi:ribose transport system permease protein
MAISGAEDARAENMLTREDARAENVLTRVVRDLAQLLQLREVNVLIALVVMGALISSFTPYFLTVDNLMGVSRSFSLTAIMSIGMVMVIITGGIDLSVGSAMGLAGLITALCFDLHYSQAFSIAAGLGVGLLFGLSNGLLVTVMELPPFIATLGTLSIGRGFMYMITHGVPLTPAPPDSFSFLGQGYIGPVPVPVVILLVLTVVFSLVMVRTRFGRHVYATGGNENAARLSGVKTNRVKLAVYVLSSMISSLAGVIAFSRYLSAEPASGFGSELEVIAAAAIGGASLAGGIGSVTGAVVGAALIGEIANGVVLLNVNTYAQQAITGGVIIIAVSLDMLRGKLRGRRG